MSDINFKVGWLKDPADNQKFAPKTTTNQVLTGDGENLTTKLEILDQTTGTHIVTADIHVSKTDRANWVEASNFVKNEKNKENIYITYGQELTSNYLQELLNKVTSNTANIYVNSESSKVPIEAHFAGDSDNMQYVLQATVPVSTSDTTHSYDIRMDHSSGTTVWTRVTHDYNFEEGFDETTTTQEVTVNYENQKLKANDFILNTGKSFSSHTHDDYYYTEAEIDNKISKLDSSLTSKISALETSVDDNLSALEASTADELSKKAPLEHNHNIDWNNTTSTDDSYIANKPSITKGTGSNAVVIGTGQAIGDYSLAGGSNNKNIISDLIGSDLLSGITNIEPSKAQGAVSLAFGAGTKALSIGTIAIGANTSAGCRGFYYWSIDFTNKVITLSTNQKPINLGTRKWTDEAKTQLSNLAVGDTISMVNSSHYVLCSKITAIDTNAGTITVDNIPFTEIKSQEAPTAQDYAVICPSKPTVGTVELGFGAFSIGYENKATGIFAHAEGYKNLGAGNYSHVEGQENTAGYSAHAEGSETQATGSKSHAEGGKSIASGDVSHAEGYGAHASGYASHAEGQDSVASGDVSHAEGYGTIANTIAQHVQGKYNFKDTENKYAHIIGGGTSASDRKNIHTVDWEGNAWYQGNVYVSETNQSTGKKLATEEFVTSKYNELNTKVEKATPFVATYNQTTYNEIKAAHDLNRPIQVYREFELPAAGAYDADDNMIYSWQELLDMDVEYEEFDGYDETGANIWTTKVGKCVTVEDGALKSIVTYSPSTDSYTNWSRNALVDVTKLVIDNSVTTIKYNGLTGFKIKEFILPNTLTTIEEDAFSYVDSAVIYIPRSVTNISYRAFYGSWYLMIKYEGTEEAFNTIASIIDFNMNAHELMYSYNCRVLHDPIYGYLKNATENNFVFTSREDTGEVEYICNSYGWSTRNIQSIKLGDATFKYDYDNARIIISFPDGGQ